MTANTRSCVSRFFAWVMAAFVYSGGVIGAPIHELMEPHPRPQAFVVARKHFCMAGGTNMTCRSRRQRSHSYDDYSPRLTRAHSRLRIPCETWVISRQMISTRSSMPPPGEGDRS